MKILEKIIIWLSSIGLAIILGTFAMVILIAIYIIFVATK
jgi:hypothetical protein